MEKHKPYTVTCKIQRIAFSTSFIDLYRLPLESMYIYSPPFDTHDNGRASCYWTSMTAVEQTAMHDAQVSGKADRYSVRMTAAEQAAIPDAQGSGICAQQTAIRLASAV